ncbi:MAG: hypothetical protein ACFFDW_02160 [Candidatus Thorarchaeota archaeon]
MDISENTLFDTLIEDRSDVFNTSISEELLNLEQQMPKKILAGEIDKLTHVLSYTADQQINCVLTLEGHFDLDRLRRAITLTYYAEPVLGSRFIVLPDEVYWHRRDDLHQFELCQFEKPTNIEQAINKFVTSSIDARVELPLRIMVLRGETGDVLCIKVAHEAIDGGGIQDYISLLTSFYRKLKINPSFLPQPNQNNNRFLKQVFKGLNIFQKVFVTLSLRIRTPNMTFPWKSLEAKTRKFAVHRIAADSYRKIKDYSKKLKVTVTDLIVTAYFRAMARLTKHESKKPLISTYTVNLRSYMPNFKATSLCNLTTASHPKIKMSENEPFEKTLKKVYKSTQKIKRQLPGLEAALFCRLLFSMPFVKSKEILEKSIQKEVAMNATFPIITNIGLVRSEDIDFGDVVARDGYIITPFMKSPGFLMGTITFEESLIFSMGYFEESYETQTIKHFLQMMEEELLLGVGS